MPTIVSRALGSPLTRMDNRKQKVDKRPCPLPLSTVYSPTAYWVLPRQMELLNTSCTAVYLVGAERLGRKVELEMFRWHVELKMLWYNPELEG